MKNILTLLFFMIATLHATSLEKVTLALGWKYQFEFAGFIAAKEKGFYEEAGLDVSLLEHEKSDILEDVLEGKSTYGLINSPFAVKDKKLKPIVILASYLQLSPLAFVTQPEVKTPSDFIGKTLMGTPYELENSSLALFMDHFFISKANTKIIDHTFNTDAFVDKKVDIMSVFTTNELYELDQKGIKYNVFSPSDFGFITGALNLFTSPKEPKEHAERTEAFIEASKKGWEYALSHEDELVNIIYEKYSQEKSKNALKFEAKEMKKLMLLDFYDIGDTSKELIYRILKQLKNTGKIDENQNLDHYFLEDFTKTNAAAITLSDQEHAYLKTKEKLNICVDPAWMPFEALKSGKHVGIAADLFDLFETKISTAFHVVETPSWETSVTFVKNRKCDILSLDSKTEDREKYLDFTSAYIDLPIVAAAPKDAPFVDDINDLKNKKIGIVKSYAIAEILKSKYPELNIIEVDSIHDGLHKVKNGTLDYYLDNLIAVAFSIQRDFTQQLVISGRLDEKVSLVIGTRNDEPHLHTIFEKLIRSLDESEKQAIYNKWVVVDEKIGYDLQKLWVVFGILTLVLFFVLFSDFRLRRYNKLLEHSSTTDKLTGLYNRIKLDHELQKQDKLTKRYHTHACLIMIDIDRFKAINDHFGHPKGDIVLHEIANILKTHSRETDIIGRWGGEEFMIILPMTAKENAKLLAENYRKMIAEHLFAGLPRITASFGIQCIDGDKPIAQIIEEADQALYSAKKQGRNCVVCFGDVQG